MEFKFNKTIVSDLKQMSFVRKLNNVKKQSEYVLSLLSTHNTRM
jgi:hypothetical protein